jgi:hypothetical protein
LKAFRKDRFEEDSAIAAGKQEIQMILAYPQRAPSEISLLGETGRMGYGEKKFLKPA